MRAQTAPVHGPNHCLFPQLGRFYHFWTLTRPGRPWAIPRSACTTVSAFHYRTNFSRVSLLKQYDAPLETVSTSQGPPARRCFAVGFRPRWHHGLPAGSGSLSQQLQAAVSRAIWPLAVYTCSSSQAGHTDVKKLRQDVRGAVTCVERGNHRADASMIELLRLPGTLSTTVGG